MEHKSWREARAMRSVRWPSAHPVSTVAYGAPGLFSSVCRPESCVSSIRHRPPACLEDAAVFSKHRPKAAALLVAA